MVSANSSLQDPNALKSMLRSTWSKAEGSMLHNETLPFITSNFINLRPNALTQTTEHGKSQNNGGVRSQDQIVGPFQLTLALPFFILEEFEQCIEARGL